MTNINLVFQRNSWTYKLASIIVSLAFITLATLAVYSVQTYLFQPPVELTCGKLGIRSKDKSFNSQPLENITDI